MTSTTRLRRNTLTVLLVLGTAGLLGGCAASAGQAPEPTASASATQTGPVWTTLADSAAFKALTAEQQAKITSLDSMDMATFEQQSLEDQLAFGAFVREVYQDDALASLAKAAPDITVPAAKDQSAESIGQEILDDENLKFITALHSTGLGFGSAEQAEPSYSAKLAPSRVLKSASEIYENISKVPDVTMTEAEVVEGVRGSLAAKKATAESGPWVPEGAEYGGRTHKIIQAVTEDGTTKNQFYFTYVPFTDIRGNEDGTWVLSLNILESYDTWNPNLTPAS